MSRLAGVVALPAVLTVLGLSACSVEVSVGSTIGKDEVAEQAMGVLSEKGQRPKDVTCPEDVDAEVDAKTTCTATAEDGTEYDVNVTVTEVGDNDRAKLDVVARDAPATGEIDKAGLEQAAGQMLSQQLRRDVGTVSCPESVAAEVGAQTRCVLTNPQGTRFGVTIRVTEADPESGNVNIYAKVDGQPLEGEL
ncbi:DUF4333 domain-containing protein [Prauserella rugosa]|uniref:Uncharacterized protein DUF4333 n=1 Tax=Prauserella rugosa TaxID=43354 RepID=A0A660CLU7_9PSEU|nr:DUF4333 domain-containing protein [Prauserella rugosa]KID31092.1 protein of unknown function (DUF4333) [Prauserella sp. Am3]TWH22867.1 uncharacterized protein DUF4333 [Prauserella rugosa]